MRADLEAVLPMLDNPKGRKLHERIAAILELEKYTLLTPPYDDEAVKELFLRAQNELGFRFATEYYWFLKCCDGGLLFTNDMFSLLDPDDEDYDLVSANKYLREEGIIPPGTAAVGVTNYGAYIVQKAGGSPEMGIWNPAYEPEEGEEEDPEAGTYLAEFADFYAFLDYVLEEARYLLEDDSLPEIEDTDDEDDGEDDE
ncbi:MAG: SMI1/KNR4 family protein [Clostridia bacterium]|nr:SMI1/KNR4 family protein [Clostridia bacterium]